MRYGISVGGIVLRMDKLLLVHHYEKGKYDYWVPPGGRLEGEESIPDCAVREVWEETNLTVKPGKILFIQEFLEPDYHFVKLFLLCQLTRGEISTRNNPAGEEFMTEASFFLKAEIEKMTVFPETLHDLFWQDLEKGFPEVRYLGKQTINF